MYTVEIYKSDKRTKSGERLAHKADHDTDNLSMLEHSVRHTWLKRDGYRYEIHKTYLERKNIMTGELYQERYDTPYSCSPSSESYWSA